MWKPSDSATKTIQNLSSKEETNTATLIVTHPIMQAIMSIVFVMDKANITHFLRQMKTGVSLQILTELVPRMYSNRI